MTEADDIDRILTELHDVTSDSAITMVFDDSGVMVGMISDVAYSATRQVAEALRQLADELEQLETVH